MKSAYFILLAAILTSCNAKQKQQVLNTDWVVKKLVINNHDIPKTNNVILKLNSETQFSIQLDANRCGGTMKLTKKKIKIENAMMCTKMCCDSQFSLAVLQALEMIDSYTFKNNSFVLKGPNNTRIYFKKFIKQVSPNTSTQTNAFAKGEVLATFNKVLTETEVSKFLISKGLTLDHFIINRKDLKIALVKVPVGKEQFWVAELQKSKNIKSAELNSIATITNETDEVISSNTNNPFIEITKTVCYGRCPAYSMKIFKNGSIEYHGDHFVETLGDAKFSISPQRVKYLFDAIDKIHFNTFKNEYDGGITDLPSTFITYKGKKIRLRYHIPKELQELAQSIHQFAISTGHINAPTKSK